MGRPRGRSRRRTTRTTRTTRRGGVPDMGFGRLGGSPHLRRDLPGQVVDIGAPVAVLRDLRAPTDRDHGATEVAHLRPEVVEVVLARDLVAGGLQHAAEQVADEGAPRVADMERAGRVGRHELHVDAAGRGGPDPSPGPGRGQDAGDQVLQRRVGEAQVQEARRRDGDRRQQRAGSDGSAGRADLGRQLGGDRLCDPQWLHPVRPGELHRHAGREIAVLGLGRSFDVDRRQLHVLGGGRQGAGRDRACPGRSDGIAGAGAQRRQVGKGLMRKGVTGEGLVHRAILAEAPRVLRPSAVRYDPAGVSSR